MERAEAEKKILKHMEAIRDVMREFSPHDPYVTMYVWQDGTIHFWNRYWERPEELQIYVYKEAEEVSE